jgi:Ca2+-binding EF-hand superfamily protein
MGRGPGGPGSLNDLAAMIMGFDADGDGRVTRAELPERMRQRFERMDDNGDGAIDAEEAQAVAERMARYRDEGRTGR